MDAYDKLRLTDDFKSVVKIVRGANGTFNPWRKIQAYYFDLLVHRDKGFKTRLDNHFLEWYGALEDYYYGVYNEEVDEDELESRWFLVQDCEQGIAEALELVQ